MIFNLLLFVMNELNKAIKTAQFSLFVLYYWLAVAVAVAAVVVGFIHSNQQGVCNKFELYANMQIREN